MNLIELSDEIHPLLVGKVGSTDLLDVAVWS